MLLDAPDWCGLTIGDRPESGRRVAVVDQENDEDLAREALRAFGVTNVEEEQLLYLARQGLMLDEPRWTAEIREALGDHRPHLLIVETAATATRAELNSNDDVAKLYRETLHPLVDKFGIGLLLSMHHRKEQAATTRGMRAPGQRTIGARRWTGQAASGIELDPVGEPTLVPVLDRSGEVWEREIRMRPSRARGWPGSRLGPSGSAASTRPTTSPSESRSRPSLRWRRRGRRSLPGGCRDPPGRGRDEGWPARRRVELEVNDSRSARPCPGPRGGLNRQGARWGLRAAGALLAGSGR